MSERVGVRGSVLELAPAMPADSLVSESGDLCLRPAKSASVGDLAEHDVSSFNGDDQVVAFADVEQAAGFGGDHDATQIVDSAGDSRVHEMRKPTPLKLTLESGGRSPLEQP